MGVVIMMMMMMVVVMMMMMTMTMIAVQMSFIFRLSLRRACETKMILIIGGVTRFSTVSPGWFTWLFSMFPGWFTWLFSMFIQESTGFGSEALRKDFT